FVDVTVKSKINLLVANDRKSDRNRAAAPHKDGEFRVFGTNSGLSVICSFFGHRGCSVTLLVDAAVAFMQFAWLQYWQYNTRHWCQSNYRISAMRVPDQTRDHLKAATGTPRAD
ncbi:MAG: hypothetical protein OXG36_04855, partial [Caldilineaceae bacterium]|nr:hypothetical protein [Caldilineaceae bacterium]